MACVFRANWSSAAMALHQVQVSSIKYITSSHQNAPCIHTVHKVRERCDVIDQRAKTGKKEPCYLGV